MISLQFDPYDRTTILETEMETFVFEKLLEKMNRLLLAKIIAQRFEIPFSSITYAHPGIFEDIEDCRCTTIRDMGGIENLAHSLVIDNYEMCSNIFVTPNFLQSFDFMGGYEYKILYTKVFYAALQLGIYILDE
jgi:hypothetical protein